MKNGKLKLLAIILAGVLGVSALGGCSAKEKTDEKQQTETTDEELSQTETTDEDSTNEEAPETKFAIGTFETTDIDGNSYTEKIFGEYELTMVNVFATWCSPCVQELPELQKLYEEMEGKNISLVGIVMDAVDENGNQDEEGLEKAKVLKENVNITYPLLIPDSGNMNGCLNMIQAFPTTFFVDKSGNIVGNIYQGSGTLEDWRGAVEQELADLKGEE